jgi:hypothetical protein
VPKEPSSARRAREQRKLQLVRDLVKGLDHDEVPLLAEAAELRAVVLDHLDRQYPDPDRRRDAARLRALAELSPARTRLGTSSRSNTRRQTTSSSPAHPEARPRRGWPPWTAASTPTPSWTSWPQPTGEPTSRYCGSTGSNPETTGHRHPGQPCPRPDALPAPRPLTHPIPQPAPRVLGCRRQPPAQNPTASQPTRGSEPA